MRVNTTESGFAVNWGGKEIVFTVNFNIQKTETSAQSFFKCKFHFGTISVHE